MTDTMTRKAALTERYKKALSKAEKQKTCRHIFKPVPEITAYLQCPKCGARCDAD